MRLARASETTVKVQEIINMITGKYKGEIIC
jgi:DNA-binding HxlR family transcriptional regulator